MTAAQHLKAGDECWMQSPPYDHKRFDRRVVVLGPVAFQPGYYRVRPAIQNGGVGYFIASDSVLRRVQSEGGSA